MVDMLHIVYTTVLVLALVSLTQVAHATNVSDYNYGYKAAIWASHCLAHPSPPDAAGEADDCERATISPEWACSGEITTIGNQTACNDGFFTGFAHWCSSDVNGCVGQLKEAYFNATAYWTQQERDHR
jgi:hypothetical protein